MKIGLLNLEPKINNVALMKISSYHKMQGDEVEMYIDFNKLLYDKIYCSSLFDFTDKSQVPENAICGGTGFDLTTKLPENIEKCNLDYSIYPNCETSYVWFSRGCIRNCSFCVVRKKEGYIYSTKPTNLNKRGKTVEIMDNSFFGNPNWKDAEEYLDFWQKPIIFSSGIDVRIFKPEHAEFINKYRIKKIHTAWDNPKVDLIPKFKELTKYIKPYKIMAYVLIGYDSIEEEDLMRVTKLDELKIDPFVMPFNKKDEYQKRFARWVNHKAVFKTVKWKDYRK
jgi:radical SAM superfamily enzyme YgiQ (UPF0313 family)